VAKWTFEPGHTAAEFCARHMMVTHVRGHFKNVRGSLEFDPGNPQNSSVKVTLDATGLWTGEPQRDAHLRSADFLDVEHYPEITFRSTQVSLVGGHDYTLTGDLTIRGVTRRVTLKVTYLGQRQTPWWEDGVDKGPKISDSGRHPGGKTESTRDRKLALGSSPKPRSTAMTLV